MLVGFDTIGNATAICYDQKPILVTDPWIVGDVYFRSWTLSHEIPKEQLDAIHKSEYIWLSHGHPDHLSAQSLAGLTGKKILLPNHVGGRIAKGLLAKGFQIEIMKDRVWYQLSDKIKVLCIADYNQDAILLIDINGRLLVNLNDASDRGWSSYVRKVVKQYDKTFLMVLTGLADSSIYNAFDEKGGRLPDLSRIRQVGPLAALKCHFYGTKYFIPFSSLHIHQRKDSLWANETVPDLSEYSKGFNSTSSEVLPAYISYDCTLDQWNKINPPQRSFDILEPSAIKDSWDDCLEVSDVKMIREYFNSIEHLKSYLDYINVRVGGEDHIIELQPRQFNLGLRFDVPRNSLMTCIQHKIFDDLIIGNYMRTHLEGNWDKSRYEDDFIPYVSKYADNGEARTNAEIRKYFSEYAKRSFFDFIKHRFEHDAKKYFHYYIPRDSFIFKSAKKSYFFLKGMLR